MTGIDTRVPGAAAEERPRSRMGFWILIGILAVTGLAMAFLVIFGLAESKASGLVGFLFLADLYLVVSLVARHRWLRLTLWVGTAISFVFGVVTVFWPNRDYYVNSNNLGADPDEWKRTTFGVLNDTLYAVHTVLAVLLALGIVSLAYRWIVKSRPFTVVYFAMFVTAIIAAILWAVGFIVEGDDRLAPYQLGTSILALTAAAIVVIAAFVMRNTQAAEERASSEAARGVAHPLGSPEHDAALRALVREYVEEYLAERER